MSLYYVQKFLYELNRDAELHEIEWADHLQRMRDGIETYGPVREGVYAVTGYDGVDHEGSS